MQQRRRYAEQPSPKIAGFVYVAVGFMAIVMSGFFLALRDSMGANPNYITVICSALAVYGLVRIITGIRTIRKASVASGPFTLEGKTPIVSVSKPEEKP